MRADTFNIDMTAMYVFHDALRRDLEQLARATARTTDDPREVLQAALGWELFKTYLHVHHTSEDELLWPVMRNSLASRTDDLLLLDEMEAEHAALDPLLTAIDEALANRDGGPQQLGALIDALATGLRGHLKHEEDQTLPLIDATLTPEQFAAFGGSHPRKIGPGMRQYLPWLLDGASAQDTANLLALMPEQLRLAYQNEWHPAYTRLHLWGH